MKMRRRMNFINCLLLFMFSFNILSCSQNNLKFSEVKTNIKTRITANVFENVAESQKATVFFSVPDRTKLELWKPIVFSKNGKLSKKWGFDVAKDKEHLNDLKYINVIGQPNGWSIQSFLNKESKQIKGIINPDNGDYTECQFEQGISDGLYVYGDYSFSISNANCRRISDNKKIWESISIFQMVDSDKFHIVANNLYFASTFTDCSLYKINPSNGDIFWRIRPKSDHLPYKDYICTYESTKNAIWALVKKINSFDQDDNNEDIYLPSLFKVDIDSGKTSIIDIPFDIKQSSPFKAYNNYLYFFSIEGKLIIYDTTTYKIKVFDDIKNLIADDDNIIDNILTNGEVVIIKLHKNGENREINYYIDTSNSTKNRFIDENIIEARNINNSLIFEDSKQLRGIDPETLETTWWIDLDENMKNAHVEWLDWRGVLVVSDNEIACYAPKK